ncbi:DUF58 domain-containing protein [Marinomonas sp. C2222]|uniref:DUF58 domain-containing protein n=1 Tax=Marinomonas sargassi TaxID=2984494 RepID=A0ABT2YQJ8_9GAMM|nr:DUF58 domain-containing protein [Marinomonas sargassi]MCV2402172.1 DUF58 domain-containing protein [Marinomonas sargassi]
MMPLLSPPSPILDEAHFTLLAHYAKHLGRAPKAMRFSSTAGESRSRKKGHGMEMLELRSYQASDDLRHIDWRVTARTGQAHTRLYAQENDHQRLLLLDLSNGAYFGTRHTFVSTRLIQLAGLIAWRSKQQGDTLSYQLSYGEQNKGSNKAKDFPLLMQSLKDASELHHRSAPSPSTSVWANNLMAQRSHNKDVIILTDKQNWSQQDDISLMQLAKHNMVHWIQVFDSNTFKLPPGQYQMADSEGIKQVNVTQQSMQKSKALFLEENTALTKKLASFGIRYQLFDISESPETIARYLLSQGALR